jgi:hypothetical protein
MKRLLMLLILSLGIVYSQKVENIQYTCTDYFEGSMVFDNIMWQPTVKLYGLPKLIIKDKVIVVKHKKTFFKNPTLVRKEQMEDGHIEIVWKAKDKKNVEVYVILLQYHEMEQIYFQYDKYIYGYEMQLINKDE